MVKSLKIGLFFTLAIIFSINPLINFRVEGRKYSNVQPSPNELISEVNALRISNGLPPYNVNQILMYVAQAHADYQASIGSVTHYGSDGSRPFQRALAAGYPVAGDLSQGGFFSENITAGRNLSVSNAVLSWQQDAPHLNTMLSSIHQDIGAGVAIVEDKIYYTIDVGLSSDGFNSSTPGNIPETNPYPQVNVNPIITSTPDSSGAIIHTVKLGETIWVISQIYKVPESEIIHLNNLPNEIIYVGDQLLIRSIDTATPNLPTQTTTPQSSMTAISEPLITKTPTLDNSNGMSNQIIIENDNESTSIWIFVFSLIIFIGITIFAIFRIRLN